MLLKIFSRYSEPPEDLYKDDNILPEGITSFVYSNDKQTFYTYGNEYFDSVENKFKDIYFELVGPELGSYEFILNLSDRQFNNYYHITNFEKKNDL